MKFPNKIARVCFLWMLPSGSLANSLLRWWFCAMRVVLNTSFHSWEVACYSASVLTKYCSTHQSHSLLASQECWEPNVFTALCWAVGQWDAWLLRTASPVPCYFSWLYCALLVQHLALQAPGIWNFSKLISELMAWFFLIGPPFLDFFSFSEMANLLLQLLRAETLTPLPSPSWFPNYQHSSSSTCIQNPSTSAASLIHVIMSTGSRTSC